VKILCISDEEVDALWEHYRPGRLAEYDLIISCGDLNYNYLEFLVTMARCPVLYVPGNHDSSYLRHAPEGCDCIDGRIVEYNGLRIMGLGGCRWYHPGPYQYSEKQMRRRIRKLRFALWRTKGVDIVVTHAPPHGVGDAEDRAHWGFRAFLELLDKYKPRYLLHGHVHMSYGKRDRENRYGDTRVINVSERYVLDIPDAPCDPKNKNMLLWRNRGPKEQADN
jgi:Icc-related predicted phosphoesterase